MCYLFFYAVWAAVRTGSQSPRYPRGHAEAMQRIGKVGGV